VRNSSRPLHAGPFTVNQFAARIGCDHVSRKRSSTPSKLICRLVQGHPFPTSFGLPEHLRRFCLPMVTLRFMPRDPAPKVSHHSLPRMLRGGSQGSNRPRNRVTSHPDSHPLFRCILSHPSRSPGVVPCGDSLFLHTTHGLWGTDHPGVDIESSWAMRHREHRSQLRVNK